MHPLPVGPFADEDEVVITVLALLRARPLAGLGWLRAEGVLEHLGHRIGGGLARLAGAGQHHLVIPEVLPIGMAAQVIGAVDVLRVDRRHDEGRGPFAQLVLVMGNQSVGLVRPFESGRQGEGIVQNLDQGRLLRRRLHRRAEAGGGPARKRPLHRADPPLYARRGASVLRSAFLLEHQHAEIEGDRIETARKTDARTALLRGLVMERDLFVHPCRFAAQIGIIGARPDAGRDEGIAIELVGADRGEDDARTLAHRVERGGVIGIGDDQRGGRRRADLVAHPLELARIAARHRPFRRIGRAAIFADEMFGDEATRVTGRPIDHDIEFACGFAHHRSPCRA